MSAGPAEPSGVLQALRAHRLRMRVHRISQADRSAASTLDGRIAALLEGSSSTVRPPPAKRSTLLKERVAFAADRISFAIAIRMERHRGPRTALRAAGRSVRGGAT